MKLFRILIYVILTISATGSATIAQDSTSSPLSFDLGTDFVSRYIWRGLEIGKEPHFQPYASLAYDTKIAGSFTLGIWGSYGFSGDYSENDFYLNYSLPTTAGNFSIQLIDYCFPYLGIPLTETKGNGEGAHTLELGFAYTGTEVFPVSFVVSNNIYNDVPDTKSLYLELGYPVTIGESELNIFIGAAKGKSVWYLIETDKFEFTNVGFNASRELKITDDFSLPLSVGFTFNPYLKKSYFIFKITL